MAYTSISVRGLVTLPTDEPAAGYRLKFQLKKADKDSALVVPSGIYYTVPSDGNIDVQLWPNARGIAGTVYYVYLIPPRTADPNQPMGTLTVPDVAGPVNIWDHFDAGPPPTLSDAEAAELAAQGYAADAAASASRIDLGALDAAVLQTGIDRAAAELAQAGAELAETNAETARDAAFVNADVYDDEATGRAAVADGEQFSVVEGEYIARYKRDSASASSVKFRMPSGSLTEEVYKAVSTVNRFGHPTSPVPSGSGTASNNTFVMAPAVATDGILLEIEVSAAAAGTVTFSTWSKSGDVFTRVRSVDVDVALGVQTLTGLWLPVEAGEYLGFSANNLVKLKTETSDGDGWYFGAAGATSFTDATITTSSRFMLAYNLYQADRLDALETANTQTKKERVGHLGTIPATGSSVDTSLYALEEAATNTGRLKKLNCYTTAAGTVRVMVFSKSGDVFTVVHEQTVANAGGFESLSVDLPVEAGQFVGVQSTNIGFRSGVADTTGWYGNVGTNSFTDAAPSRTSRVLFGAEIDYEAPPVFTEARPKAFDLPFKSSLILSVGQSLWEGSDGAITTTGASGVKGFAAYPTAPDAIYDASVANTERAPGRGEWPVLNAASQIKTAMKRDHGFDMAVENTLVVANTAVSGARLDEIDKGTAPYNAGLAMATALGGIVDGSSGVLAVSFGQGESGNIPTGEAAYLAGLIQLAKDLDADLRAATGQDRRVPLFTYQMNSKINFVGKMHLQASLDCPLIYCVGPMYQYIYYDSLHIDAASAQLVGALHGEAIKTVCIDGNEWEPLRPIDAKVLGNTITLTFNKSGLLFDTTALPAQTNNGFAVKNVSDVSVSVTSVEVLNGNQVRLTCASAPQPDWTVQYGANAATGRSDSFVGSMGNLRDAAGDERKFNGTALHNWCVIFDWTL